MIFSSKIQNLPIQLEKISKKHLQKMEKDNIIWIVKNLQILTVGGRKLKEKITILIADDNIDFTIVVSIYKTPIPSKCGILHLTIKCLDVFL